MAFTEKYGTSGTKNINIAHRNSAAVILFTVKKLRKAAYYYHFINFAALTLMLAGWHFIPQHLNTAFIPLVMSLWLRSGYGVYRKIWNIGYEKY